MLWLVDVDIESSFSNLVFRISNEVSGLSLDVRMLCISLFFLAHERLGRNVKFKHKIQGIQRLTFKSYFEIFFSYYSTCFCWFQALPATFSFWYIIILCPIFSLSWSFKIETKNCIVWYLGERTWMINLN